MLAVELRHELQALGVTLAADGDRLRFHPRCKVTGELLARLQTHKGELLQILQPQAGNGYTTHATTGERAVVSPAVPQDLQPHGDVPQVDDVARPVAPVRIWPPVVPDFILAAPFLLCGDCGRLRVVGGQPGRPSGVCFRCWIRSQERGPVRAGPRPPQDERGRGDLIEHQALSGQPAGRGEKRRAVPKYHEQPKTKDRKDTGRWPRPREHESPN